MLRNFCVRDLRITVEWQSTRNCFCTPGKGRRPMALCHSMRGTVRTVSHRAGSEVVSGPLA